MIVVFLAVLAGCGSDNDDTAADASSTVGTERVDVDDGDVDDGDADGDAPFTFDTPDGWTAMRCDGFGPDDYNVCFSRDSNAEVLDDLIARYGADGAPSPEDFDWSSTFDDALNDDAAAGLGYLMVSVDEPPWVDFTGEETWPWDTTDDVEAYVAEVWPDDATELVQIGSHVGLFRWDASSTVWSQAGQYELVVSPGVRLFAINAIRTSEHTEVIEAIIASVRPR